MAIYGFAEKRKEVTRVCPICKKAFTTTSKRRKYCYTTECAEARYQKKLEQKKDRWHLHHLNTNEGVKK